MKNYLQQIFKSCQQLLIKRNFHEFPEILCWYLSQVSFYDLLYFHYFFLFWILFFLFMVLAWIKIELVTFYFENVFFFYQEHFNKKLKIFVVLTVGYRLRSFFIIFIQIKRHEIFNRFFCSWNNNTQILHSLWFADL